MLKNVLMTLSFIIVVLTAVIVGLTQLSTTFQLMALVYLVEKVTIINFLSIADIILYFSIVTLGLIGVIAVGSLMFSNSEEEFKGYFEGVKSIAIKSKNNVLTILSIFIAIGVVGSFLNGAMPDKKTAYIMAGGFVSGSAIESCTKENSTCKELIKSIDSDALKILSGEKISETIEVAEKVVSDVKEKATESVDKVIETVDAVGDAATDATESLNETVDAVGDAAEKMTETIETTSEKSAEVIESIKVEA